MNLKPKEMLIVTPPNELHFFGPFNRPNVTTMKLKNPTDQTLLFKIKTTAPKRYCVRPNLGVINPNETSTVEICLQPFNYDPNEKNKHKFMVQTMVNPAAEEDVHKAWKEAEQSGQLMDVKLKCVFEMQANAPTSNDTSASAAATADVKKQSPKATNEEKIEKQISNMQSSEPTDTLVDELRQLREENNVLRKDNVKLKDQMARLLINSSSPTSKPRANEPYTPLMAEKQIPMFYIAIAVAMVIFGILLGKYMF